MARRATPAPAAIVEKIAIPIVPPISWPVELRPEIMPVSSSRAPVRIEMDTETTATPRPTPAMSIPGRTSAQVAAVLTDVGEERHAARRDRERCGEWPANASVADDVAGRVGADSCRQGERDEGEAGRERPHVEDVLEVERAEQEEPEDRAGGSEHQEEAAADCTIRQPLDPQERRVGVPLAHCEGSEPHDAAEADEQRLEGRPADAARPG